LGVAALLGSFLAKGMLDDIGFADALSVEFTSTLFVGNQHLVHTTSAIRYPTFVGGKNYTGHRPPARTSPLLQSFIHGTLASELELVPHALVIPPGDAVEDCLRLSSSCAWAAGRGTGSSRSRLHAHLPRPWRTGWSTGLIPDRPARGSSTHS
jgi:hypothetical protein